MATLINSQLDFILFFYGLAFILLGTTGFAISRERVSTEPWALLGFFAFIHGIGEWLDLSALVIGDTPVFAAIRTAVMTGSFIILLDFARLGTVRLEPKFGSAWLRCLYIPLAVLVIIVGIDSGIAAANAVARYFTGFVAAAAVSLLSVAHAQDYSGTIKRLAYLTAVEFALYAVAAGLIVPWAPFWPADTFNYDWFVHLTGLPIQLVRGVLACAISFSLWRLWGQELITKVASQRYTAYARKQYRWTLIAMAVILVCGWILTEFLGGIYKQNVEAGARGNIDLLASRLTGETALVEGMVKALAGTPSILPLFADGSDQDRTQAKATLDLDVEASGAKLGLILDASGRVIASSGHEDTGASENDARAAFFQRSIKGQAGYDFALDRITNERDYYASYPIRAADGSILGVAVLKKSLAAFDADLRQFDHPYFLIDPDGVIVMTNRPAMLFRPFWPLSPEKRLALASKFGSLDGTPLLKQEIEDAKWTSIDGERNYVRRRFAHFSQWSLVILKPTQEIFASRILGIVITFLVTVMALVYLFGRERWMRDRVEIDKRLELQELARDLGFQATTDPLTGLSNRLKLDQALAGEILRSDRYKTPFGLVLFDVDHFKDVNDTYGHQIGDKVLVELARFVSSRIRNTDLLARWGGEEFVLLLPGSDGRMAYQTAEKLRNELSQIPFESVGRVTCSFGVAQYAEGDTAQTVIARADQALYRAKMNGRNQGELASQPPVTQSLAY